MKNMIDIHNAGIKFGKWSLDGIELKIPKGYITGVVGHNGAGKTTFLNMIMGLYPGMKGSISVGGYDCVKQREKMLDITGFVSQERKFFMEYSAIENEDMYIPFYSKWDSEKYRKYLKSMNVPCGTKLKSLSKGSYIKYQLAFALANKPSLLILDEPAAGLDPVFRADFLKLLQELIADEEMTIVISSNIEDDLDKIADYIVEVKDGGCRMKEAYEYYKK